MLYWQQNVLSATTNKNKSSSSPQQQKKKKKREEEEALNYEDLYSFKVQYFLTMINQYEVYPRLL